MGWNETDVLAFNEVKILLRHAVELSLCGPGKIIFFCTDASDMFSCGAVTQCNPTEIEKANTDQIINTSISEEKIIHDLGTLDYVRNNLIVYWLGPNNTSLFAHLTPPLSSTKISIIFCCF